MKFQIEKRIIGVFIFALITLFAFGFYSKESITDLIEISRQAEHTQKILQKLYVILSNVTDAETGQRGYIITGDERYLEPYHRTLTYLYSNIKDLRMLLADNSIQQQRIDVLESLIAEKLAGLKERIQLRRTKGFEPAAEQVRAGRGRLLMDKIRKQIAEIENDKVGLLDAKTAKAKASAQNTILIVTFGSVIALVFGGIATYFNYRELSERKKVEKELQFLEEKLSKVFRSSPDWVTITTLKDGRYIDVNDAFMRTSGYKREDVIGQSSIALGIWVDMAERDKMVRALQERGSVHNQEVKFRTRSGDILTMLRSAELIDINGEPCIIAISRNITEYKKLEEQFYQSQKLEAIGRLTGGIAHDFNNILTSILGFGSLLQMRMEKDNPLQTYVNDMLASAEKAVDLIQSLLAFSRKQTISPMPVNLNEIVRDAEKFLSRIIGEDIDLKIDLSDKDLTVMADYRQIEQVLMNLATNARDAMPDGGTLIISTEFIETDTDFIWAYGHGRQGRYAMLSVMDTGIGMDAKTRERIFEPFFTTKKAGKGTGLGLSTVYGIIRQHNAYINVYSELGRGTIFRIYLPLIEARAEEIKPSAKEIEGITMLTGGTETILLAEDEENVRELIRELFEKFGYKVIEAVDGDDAIKKFIEHKDKIQLLFFDVIMPGRSGKDAYDEIRKIKPDVKIIFASGYSTDIIDEKGIFEGGLNFIAKPVLPARLLKKVREVLDK
jgi:PAS domain S-box-containing protein